MKPLTAAAALTLVTAATAAAHHEKSPLREAVIDGHSHDVGGATLWLLAAAIAMILALIAVQKSVFRKKSR